VLSAKSEFARRGVHTTAATEAAAFVYYDVNPLGSHQDQSVFVHTFCST
jgi:hypothetical protein